MVSNYWSRINVKHLTGMLIPMLVLMVIVMMVVPLPAFMLDLFFTVNIALALMIVMISINTLRPLDFSAFPTILLFATLLRLALNVASTRIVLVDGHTGTDAAGQVIKSFGDFVIGGNYVVGIIVFSILMIINFVVVTKGAGRVSEVSARFTLDAMPGKQMAIDADLNAGVLSQDEARERRQEVTSEADFYGSMDGASKFVKGDAIAGFLILLINIVGGLAIGMGTHDLDFSEAAEVYVLLTIGDGLVAQIPSLLLATATAIIVTRVSSTNDMSTQVVTQLGSTQALAIVSGILILLGLIPGMPTFVFLLLGSGVGGLAYWSIKHAKATQMPEEIDPIQVEQEQEAKDLSWDDIPQLDMVGLEVGYALIPLVDKAQGGVLMQRIKGVRKKLSHELGFLVQSVHIRDNLDLGPNQYNININGVVRGQGELVMGRDLAINPGITHGTLEGIPTRDPAFGLDALWIETSQREYAQTLGYTVVDGATALATHLNKVLQENAHELLGHDEAQQLLDQLSQSAPKLVESVVPGQLSVGVVAKVLQNLLGEGVAVRDIRSIVEILADQAGRSQDPDVLTAAVRPALGRMIMQQLTPVGQDLNVMTLDAGLEQQLHTVLQQSKDHGLAIEPNLAEQLLANLQNTSEKLVEQGIQPVLVVSPGVRPWLAKMVKHRVPGLVVLGYNEIPDEQGVQVVSTIEQTAAINNQ
ncbi:MAG TPA: flagellar biosynthesis protein FlhA [Oceanospirillaceae bacterium]|nr:flagellar biosynthesis protein FlhA [Oceanospirillaceae bacterium]